MVVRDGEIGSGVFMVRMGLFDQARGIAIVAMVMANSAPLLAEGMAPGFWFRVISSFPAPMFVICAGAMVALTAVRHGFGYFLQRGLFIVGMGAVVDVVANKIVPFQGFDILYLMGVVMPLAYLAAKLSTRNLLIMIVAIFMATVFLQEWFSYSAEPIMTDLVGMEVAQVFSLAVVKHWFIDGWFPLFPWVGIGFCGVLIYRWYANLVEKNEAYAFFNVRFVGLSIALTALGIVVGIFMPSPFFIRQGYVELFYPPDFGYIFSALGATGILLAISEYTTAHVRMKVLQTLGSMTLAMYVLHLLIISYVLHTFFAPISDFSTFFMIFCAHMIVIVLCAQALKRVREQMRLPIMVSWLVGR